MPSEFSNYFNLLLKTKKILVYPLSKKLGISQSYLHNVVRGIECPPTFQRCEKIASIMNLADKERRIFFELALKGRLRKEEIKFLNLVGWEKADGLDV